MSQMEQEGYRLFIKSQLERINVTLLNQKQQIQSCSLWQTTLHKLEVRIVELQKKMQLLQVYQNQNYQHQQRLFQKHQAVELLEQKLAWIEEQINRKERSLEEGRGRGSLEKREREKLEKRIEDIEKSIKKNIHRSEILSKFKRTISPLVESTKEASVDVKDQIQSLECRMKQYIQQKVQRLATDPSLEIEKKVQAERPSLKETIHDYYQEGRKGKSKNRKRKEKSHSSKRGNSKTNEEKTSQRLQSKKMSQSTDNLNLISVNEYLRLRQYRPG